MGVSSISKADPPRAGFFLHPPLPRPQTPDPLPLPSHPGSSLTTSLSHHLTQFHHLGLPHHCSAAWQVPFRTVSLRSTPPLTRSPLLWCRGWHRFSKGTCQAATSQLRPQADPTIEAQPGGAAVGPGGLFQIVLGFACPAKLSERGESQNVAKIRRFGIYRL